MIVDRLRKFDWVLFGSAVLLTAFGLAVIYSTSLGADGVNGDFTNFRKQLAFAALGIVVAFVVALFDYRQLTGFNRALYVLSLLLLVLVLIFGRTIRGTTGWFSIAGFGVQPVEAVKLIIIVVWAKYFADHARDIYPWRPILVSGSALLLILGLVIAQPDFGSAALLFAVWAALLLVSGLRRRQALIMGLLGLLAAILAWSFFLQPYQKDRVLSFLDPEADPLGRGYNVTQSIIAVGSGGLFGKGLGYGSQSQLRFLPERQTDFIFAAAAEELGFVGVLALLCLFAAFFWRCAVLARGASEDFTLLLVMGISASIAVELLINVGGNLRLMPVTGVTLPFLSYGGSSLLAKFAMVGLLESVAARR